MRAQIFYITGINAVEDPQALFILDVMVWLLKVFELCSAARYRDHDGSICHACLLTTQETQGLPSLDLSHP
jgi:hypothetical protein